MFKLVSLKSENSQRSLKKKKGTYGRLLKKTRGGRVRPAEKKDIVPKDEIWVLRNGNYAESYDRFGVVITLILDSLISKDFFFFFGGRVFVSLRFLRKKGLALLPPELKISKRGLKSFGKNEAGVEVGFSKTGPEPFNLLFTISRRVAFFPEKGKM
ncbi:MAG: hypothetical protein CM15mP58_21940 [Burkholderiaceae bacterium]|nr:MAG: hypothetical protein CM15mP58_21940 [Burkholderiaceae bacterium]